MLDGRNFLIIGARAGGYGASLAQWAISAGARVYGTTLNPSDAREISFFQHLGAELIDVPLRFDVDARDRVSGDLNRIQDWFRQRGISCLDAVIHTVAGGFPRQPSVMKAVGEILKGNLTFRDMATAVKRNVYYVNGGSFEDTIQGLAGITDQRTQYLALTYRGDLPYFISDAKKHLERLALRWAKQGKQTLIAALPEAWTQSSQFFTGIEVAIIQNYLQHLRGQACDAPHVSAAFAHMEDALADLEGFSDLMESWPGLLGDDWKELVASQDSRRLYEVVQRLFGGLRNDGKFPILRRGVEIISDFVRDASGAVVVKDLLSEGRYASGDVRQVSYRDLKGRTPIGLAEPRPQEPTVETRNRQWNIYEKDEIRKTLPMYGENFLFLDRVIVEGGELRDGLIAFGCFTIPSPEQNPILRDHFVGMPLFGGHLQMEAAAQLGSFVILKLRTDKRLVPILTATEFPDLNTMAPPGEKLTIMGVIRLPEKRNLAVDVVIENRFARSKGVIRGMFINERLLRKMMTSFHHPSPED
jgi:3-hydroxymyristoyl/3-hydroxydecanoyl-(acyl carrier protein) dehydratase/nucleoside-diphosphate-sugar epimerase